MDKTENEQPADLGRLQKRLDEHRRNHGEDKALPGWVWAAAGRLARRHGVRQTAQALGLDREKLKGASGGSAQGRAPRSGVKRGGAVTFIELASAPPPVPEACRLTLAAPGGQAVELTLSAAAATEVLLGLCQAGWGGAR